MDMPEVEWWDEFLLPPSSAGEPAKKSFPETGIKESDIYIERITNYVQHPVPLKNPKIEQIEKTVMSVYLTDKEKKRLSRNQRVANEKEKQEKIKLGLMAPPLPKIKLSNYQAIMSKEAISDPSGTEMVAKAIIQKRQDDHNERNENR